MFEKSSNIKFHKNFCPVGAELFHEDMNKRTDMMKITVTFAILQMHLINKCTNLKEIRIFT